MLYRMRIYQSVRENLAVFHEFFLTYLLPVRLRHGARLVGRWEVEDGRVPLSTAREEVFMSSTVASPEPGGSATTGRSLQPRRRGDRDDVRRDKDQDHRCHQQAGNLSTSSPSGDQHSWPYRAGTSRATLSSEGRARRAPDRRRRRERSGSSHDRGR
ncbi:MAG TPA: hypothetical protein VNF47_13475 [Streptosporangiaceae bacterium]|nr:hypothetical protein [Streptosporangiaceae bacterium]